MKKHILTLSAFMLLISFSATAQEKTAEPAKLPAKKVAVVNKGKLKQAMVEKKTTGVPAEQPGKTGAARKEEHATEPK
jgi:hypothetical protein